MSALNCQGRSPEPHSGPWAAVPAREQRRQPSPSWATAWTSSANRATAASERGSSKPARMVPMGKRSGACLRPSHVGAQGFCSRPQRRSAGCWDRFPPQPALKRGLLYFVPCPASPVYFVVMKRTESCGLVAVSSERASACGSFRVPRHGGIGSKQ